MLGKVIRRPDLAAALAAADAAYLRQQHLPPTRVKIETAPHRLRLLVAFDLSALYAADSPHRSISPQKYVYHYDYCFSDLTLTSPLSHSL